MGATDSEMGAPKGLLSVFLVFGLLLGTCLSEQACVGDACFEQSTHQLKIERSKTDPTSGLNYKERSTDLVATIDVIGVCLPGVNPNVLADTFLSCSNGKVEEVCTMVKRGWLEDKEGKSVVNVNALLATFKDLNGGEDAVRECLQIPEVYEYYEIEYYYYDYEDYFDDYLEESASGSRQRRAAGEKGKKKNPNNQKNNCNGKKGKCNKNERNSKRRNRKDGKRNCKGKNKENCGKGGNSRRKNRKDKIKDKQESKEVSKAAKKQARREKKKERKEERAQKAATKQARKERKEAQKEENTEKEARKEALSKLGLKKMPSKSSMEKLTCVQDKISELLVRCAKDILSKTN